MSTPARRPTDDEICAKMKTGRKDGYAAMRKAQALRVMPLIGPLLDAMDGIPNDLWDNMEVDAHALCSCLSKIRRAVEDDE